MIGKSLSERYATVLPQERAVAVLSEALVNHAKALVEVRAQGMEMVACLVLRASSASIRACRSVGLEIARGGEGVFGLNGRDALSLIAKPTASQRAWLETPCGPRETKVLLMEQGLALLSLETVDGKVTITPHAEP